MVLLAATVLILAATADDPIAPGLVETIAAGQPQDQILLRELHQRPSEEAIERAAQDEHAGRVAMLNWLDADHTRVELRVRSGRASNWTSQELRFAREDSLSERQRAVALALSELILTTPDEPPPPPSPGDELPPREDKAKSVRPPSVLPPVIEPLQPTLSVEMLGKGMFGLGGNQETTAGGGAAIRLRVVGDVWARLGVTLLAGSLDLNDSRLLAASFAGSVGYKGPRRGIFGSEGRVGLSFSRVSLTRTTASGDSSSDARWFPSAVVVVDGSLRLSQRVSYVLGVGGEVSLGTTRVVVGDVRSGSLPVAHLSIESGLRAYF